MKLRGKVHNSLRVTAKCRNKTWFLVIGIVILISSISNLITIIRWGEVISEWWWQNRVHVIRWQKVEGGGWFLISRKHKNFVTCHVTSKQNRVHTKTCFTTLLFVTKNQWKILVKYSINFKSHIKIILLRVTYIWFFLGDICI